MRLDDAYLDSMRQLGDPLADGVVARIFAQHDVHGVRAVLKHCVDDDHPLDFDGPAGAALPPDVRDALATYFEASEAELPELDPERIGAGEALFQLHGPEILMILCCYSLPAAYAAKKGVQVLAQTGRLESHPKRRLFETAQMVIDVMSPGGLARGDHARAHGRGIRTAQKVRLMHAAVRHLVIHHDPGFSERFGVPINQEDLAGTLTTFSVLVLEGLERIGAPLSESDRASYLYAWTAAARILGVHESLIPDDLAAARELTVAIQRRQIASSPEGDAMAAALVHMMRDMLELRLLRGLPPTLIRYFMREHADVIHLPPRDWTAVLVWLIHLACRTIDALVIGTPVSRWLYRTFNRILIEAMLVLERGGTRPPFSIPDHLADAWKVQRGSGARS